MRAAARPQRGSAALPDRSHRQRSAGPSRARSLRFSGSREMGQSRLPRFLPTVGRANREAFARLTFLQKAGLSREAKDLVVESHLVASPMRAPLEQCRATL